LRFLNADDLARELEIDAYDAAELANRLRQALVARRESFIFETVLSDPVGDKVRFLSDAAGAGYTIVLCFIGLDSARTSQARVAMRVLQGGHDVPSGKLVGRYARTLKNLDRAIRALPFVHVYDNSDLGNPFRRIAAFEAGTPAYLANPLPKWFKLPV
jgi:predicted ABC-type ATPase